MLKNPEIHVADTRPASLESRPAPVSLLEWDTRKLMQFLYPKKTRKIFGEFIQPFKFQIMSNQQTENQKKVFIAGKIAGLERGKVREKFNRREKELKALGYCVINPVERIDDISEVKIQMGEEPLDAVADRTYIMGVCLYDLSGCDELHLLHDWCDSKGCVELFEFAQRHEMKIVFELECDYPSDDLIERPKEATNKAFEPEPFIFSKNIYKKNIACKL